jgi:hypothetical protein
MNTTKLILGISTLATAGAATAGPAPLGTSLGGALGVTLGDVLGIPFGQVLIENGSLLLIAAAGLLAGICIVRRKQKH